MSSQDYSPERPKARRSLGNGAIVFRAISYDNSPLNGHYNSTRAPTVRLTFINCLDVAHRRGDWHKDTSIIQ